MTSSQQSATAAALHQQGIAYQTVAQVVTVKPGLPAYGKLKPGDLITAVDGQPVTGTSQLTALIKAHAGKPDHAHLHPGWHDPAHPADRPAGRRPPRPRR